MEKELYISPEIVEIQFRADGILCSSPLGNASNEDFIEDELDF